MNALSLGTGTGTAQTKTQALEPGQAPPLAEPVPENGDILLFQLGLRTGTGILRMTGLRKTLENTCVEGLSNFEGVPCFRH